MYHFVPRNSIPVHFILKFLLVWIGLAWKWKSFIYKSALNLMNNCVAKNYCCCHRGCLFTHYPYQITIHNTVDVILHLFHIFRMRHRIVFPTCCTNDITNGFFSWNETKKCSHFTYCVNDRHCETDYTRIKQMYKNVWY